MLEFEPRGIAVDTPAQETEDINRFEARRRLDFVAAKLGSSAMQEIVLGEGLDDFSQDDFELVGE